MFTFFDPNWTFGPKGPVSTSHCDTQSDSGGSVTSVIGLFRNRDV